MTKNKGKQLARVVSKGVSLDIEIILKLGMDCRGMAVVGQGDKVISPGQITGRWGIGRGSER